MRCACQLAACSDTQRPRSCGLPATLPRAIPACRPPSATPAFAASAPTAPGVHLQEINDNPFPILVTVQPLDEVLEDRRFAAPAAVAAKAPAVRAALAAFCEERLGADICAGGLPDVNVAKRYRVRARSGSCAGAAHAML